MYEALEEVDNYFPRLTWNKIYNKTVYIVCMSCLQFCLLAIIF